MKRVTQNIESWKEKLDDFESKANQELAAIRKCKQEIQQLKDRLFCENSDLYNNKQGNIIRDERRLILSAPEIIIGNVDEHGVLLDGGSVVVVRGNNVHVEGCGGDAFSGGSIKMRASSIYQIAEDPGMDGNEAVVGDVSEIITQARCIGLISEDAPGMFTHTPVATQGVAISSESHIHLGATRSNQVKSENIASLKEEVKEQAANLKSEAKKQADEVKGQLKELKKLMEYNQDIAGEIVDIRSNYMDIDELYDQFGVLSSSLYQSMSSYFCVLSKLAEANRKEKVLDSIDKQLSKEKGDFTTQTTGTNIILTSEIIEAQSKDGDGNFRENEQACFKVNARTVQVQSKLADGSLHKDGGIALAAQNIDLTTANPKITDKKSEYPAVGNVRVVSKNMQFEAVDYQTENDKTSETALTKDGSIVFRAQDMQMVSTETEGKATGSIHLNAKRVEVKSMDVDKEKRTDKDLAPGSAVKMVAEQVYIGAANKKAHSKKVQLVSDQVMAMADATLEIQQGGGKALVQLDGGSLSASGSNVELFGKTTMQGATTFKSEVKAGDLEAKNLKASSSFKSSNMSDGIAVPGAPSTAKLSAKLNEEELKESTK